LSGDTGPHVSPPERRRDPSAIKGTVAGFRTSRTGPEGNPWSGDDRNKGTLQAFIADGLARLQLRYPEIPVVFADSRKFGEEWTYRFLAAALSDTGSDPVVDRG
jgi:hypothetical protein